MFISITLKKCAVLKFLWVFFYSLDLILARLNFSINNFKDVTLMLYLIVIEERITTARRYVTMSNLDWMTEVLASKDSSWAEFFFNT